MAVSKKVSERLSAQIKRYQSIIGDAKSRDISESDTVVIVGDMLADAFGYRKYVEITTELAIRGTYVDLAVKVGDEVRFLIEGKAIGVTLSDHHVKQAIDYGANHGIEWVVLTNAATWRVYKIHFRQPIDKSLVFEVDLLTANPRNAQLLECFGNLCREGFTKSSMAALFQQTQATSRFSLAAVMLSEPMLVALRRELRKLFPGVKADEEFLGEVLRNEVIKREMIESEDAKQAMDSIRKAARALSKTKARAAEAATEPLPPVLEPGPIAPAEGSAQ